LGIMVKSKRGRGGIRGSLNARRDKSCSNSGN
jgi:hypothetical protein